MPEPSFKSLTEEFDRSAQACAGGKVSVDLVVAKYSLLLKYKAAQPEDRQALVDTLFRNELKWLQAQCDLSYGGDHTVTYAKTLLTRLMEPDSLPFLGKDAPERLADAGLALLRATESRQVASKNNDGDTMRALVRMAEQTLLFADNIRAFQAKLPPEAPPKKKDESLSL